MQKNNTGRALAGCGLFGLLMGGVAVALILIGAQIANRFGRFVIERPKPSQLFTEMLKDGLKSNLNSGDRETQLEAVADLGWAMDVNPQDKPFAQGAFGTDLRKLANSEDMELAAMAKTLLEQLQEAKP